jgi:hypothetical protein
VLGASLFLLLVAPDLECAFGPGEATIQVLGYLMWPCFLFSIFWLFLPGLSLELDVCNFRLYSLVFLINDRASTRFKKNG